MGTTAKATGGAEFEKAPPGTYVSRCFQVIDLGTQTVEWQGKKKLSPKILIGWELLGDERMEDGRPFMISQRYTLSLFDQAVLRQHLESWRGKPFSEDEINGGFDVKNILGAYCLLNVIHKPGTNGKIYVNVAGVMKMPKGMDKPAGSNKDVYFSTDDFAGYENLADWLQKVIAESEEFKARNAPKGAAALKEMADDIPWKDDEAEEIPF